MSDLDGCKIDSVKAMKICRAISNANMALYPVDARGLVGPGDIMPTFNAASRGGPPQRMGDVILGNFRSFNVSLQTMQMLADRTGGRAFYNTNNIASSIRRAVDDSADHYMLGFYPLEDEWNTKFHSIKVKVNRPGVEVRYRQGFYALPETRLSEKDRTTLAMDTARAPLAASRMTLMIRLDPPSSPDAPLRFELVIDPHQITLEAQGDFVTGSLHIAFLQCTTAGKILQTKQERVNLRMTQSTYQKAIENGFSLSREWAAEPGAEQLRIAVCDSGSDNIGSITVPLSLKSAQRMPPCVPGLGLDSFCVLPPQDLRPPGMPDVTPFRMR
jgi:hypothetical protein